MQVRIPSTARDAFTVAVKKYADDKGLIYSSVSSSHPNRKPPLKTQTQIVASKSSEVTITARLTSENDVVRIHVETFSFSCKATEDWRPYWKDFTAFVASQGHPRISE